MKKKTITKKNKTINDLAAIVANGFSEIGERLNETATKLELNDIRTSVDGLAKKVTDFQAELASDQIAHDRMQKYIESLDKRITKVEFRTGIKMK